MHKNKVLKLFVVLILLAVSIFFIAGTFSRYTKTGEGNATINVANWAVTIKNGDTTLNTTSQDINFVVADNDYVVSGKMAPATTATADIDVYLAGTEVAVDLIANLGTASNLPDGAALSMAVDGTTYTAGSAATIALPSGQAFDSTNGKKTVRLTLTWENSEDRNATDTAAGEAGSIVTVPITVTAQQHID